MTKLYSLALFAAKAYASSSSMDSEFAAGMAAAGVSVNPCDPEIEECPANPRTIFGSDMGLINQYGCWCYFEDEHSRTKGGPVDQIDILCKRLHDGYSCAMMDGTAAGFDCIPWEVNYNSAVGSGLALNMDINTIRTECDTQNPNTVSCENWACKIEGYFVQQLLMYFVNGGLINHANRHDNGFDPNLGCPTSQQGQDSERACCDEQPIRFPFKTYDDARQCCVSHTYDATMFDCCNDGIVRVTCPP